MRATVLSVWVFLLGSFQWLKVWAVWQRQNLWFEFPLSVSVWYLIASAVVWGGVLWVAALAVWRLKDWGRHLAFAGVAVALGQWWLERLWVMRSDYAQLVNGYLLILTLLIVGVTGMLWWQKFEAVE